MVLVADDEPNLIAVTGGSLDGARIGSFTNIALRHMGNYPGLVFTEILKGTGVTTRNREVLCAANSSGSVTVLARTHDSIEVHGSIKLLKSISAFDVVPGSASVAGSVGEEPKVIFCATFTDFSQAII